jgi:hypothetical protein
MAEVSWMLNIWRRSFPVEWIPILAIAPSTSSAIISLRNKFIHHPIVLAVFSQALLAFFIRHWAISINCRPASGAGKALKNGDGHAPVNATISGNGTFALTIFGVISAPERMAFTPWR